MDVNIASMGGMPDRYLSQSDIGLMLGQDRTIVNVWRNRFRNTPDPFPEPDAQTGIGKKPLPGWKPDRMDDIRAWLDRHPGLAAAKR